MGTRETADCRRTLPAMVLRCHLGMAHIWRLGITLNYGGYIRLNARSAVETNLSNVPIYMLSGVIIVSLIILGIERLMKTFEPFILKRNMIPPPQCADPVVLQRELGVALTTFHANHFAPTLNSFMEVVRMNSETIKIQTELIRLIQHDQANIREMQSTIAEKMAILGDRIRRD